MAAVARYDVSAGSAAPPPVVHGLLLDGASWPAWSPIDACEVERATGSGVVGEVRVFRTGRTVSREQVVAVVPDRRYEYVGLATSTSLMRGYRAAVELEPGPGGGTSIRWHGTWRSPVPGGGWLLQRFTAPFMQRCADGLARHAETQQVPPA